ncbi:MAG TPA: CPBP family intramembrane glutamic endopeptidase [Steroidobacteraceae bacterium]|nr:CPBP family intramembrane glutamic endopeptidase [Steroidobacteraceae bacterium]
MNNENNTSRPAWTLAGLFLALFGLIIITTAYRMALGPVQSASESVLRELLLFLALALLLFIVKRGEGLSFASLGWRTDHVGRSLLWGLIGALLCAVGLAASLGLIMLFKLHFGGDGKPQFQAPVWAVAITVFRAGIIEEVFYRGYAIDRLKRLTGSTPVAIVVPLLVFAAAHYRQGLGGVLIALVMGGILTAVFLKRRDLLTVITAHTLVDFVPNVVLPLISG